MQLRYRPAVATDAADCVTLRGKTRQNSFSEEQLRSLGVTAISWSEHIGSGEILGHICECNNDLVGFGFGDSATGEIVVLALLPDYEQCGIGRELLRRTTRDLAGLGHSRLFLACSPDPTSRSHGFYRHLGWRSTGCFDPHGDEILELTLER